MRGGGNEGSSFNEEEDPNRKPSQEEGTEKNVRRVRIRDCLQSGELVPV